MGRKIQPSIFSTIIYLLEIIAKIEENKKDELIQKFLFSIRILIKYLQLILDTKYFHVQ